MPREEAYEDYNKRLNVNPLPHEISANEHSIVTAREQRRDDFRGALIDRYNRLQEGEFYEININLSLMHLYYQYIGIDISALSQGFQAPLIPTATRSRFKNVQMADSINGLYKFIVNLAIHPGGDIMVPASVLSSSLIPDKLQRRARKNEMGDQQTRENWNRFLFEEENGPKKLRSMR